MASQTMRSKYHNRKRRASISPNTWTNAKYQMRIRSISSRLIASLVRSYSLVVRGDSWTATLT